jgi:hypothetical protein
LGLIRHGSFLLASFIFFSLSSSEPLNASLSNTSPF